MARVDPGRPHRLEAVLPESDEIARAGIARAPPAVLLAMPDPSWLEHGLLLTFPAAALDSFLLLHRDRDVRRSRRSARLSFRTLRRRGCRTGRRHHDRLRLFLAA